MDTKHTPGYDPHYAAREAAWLEELESGISYPHGRPAPRKAARKAKPARETQRQRAARFRAEERAEHQGDAALIARLDRQLAIKAAFEAGGMAGVEQILSPADFREVRSEMIAVGKTLPYDDYIIGSLAETLGRAI